MRSPMFAAAVAALAAAAAPAVAGPDFVADDRASSVGASDARSPQEPADEILFAVDDATLDPIAVDQLAAVTGWLDLGTGDRTVVVVEGHADRTGSAEHNAALAARRAGAVRDHLIARGVARDRIVVAVYGENGARGRPEAYDRRVVMYASRAPLARLVSAQLDREALEVVWTHRGTRLRETRGITPVAIIASRR